MGKTEHIPDPDTTAPDCSAARAGLRVRQSTTGSWTMFKKLMLPLVMLAAASCANPPAADAPAR